MRASFANSARSKLRRCTFTFASLTLSLMASGCSPLTARLPSSLEIDEESIRSFSEANVVLKQHCISCHKSGGSAAHAPFDLSDESDFVARGYVVPQDPDGSSLLYRTIHYSGSKNSVKNMPIGSTSGFTVAHYEILRNWVANIGNKPSPVADAPKAQFACQDDSKSSPTKSLMLSKLQYQNAIADLFDTATLNAVAGDLSSLAEENNHIDTFERRSLLSDQQVDAYSTLADSISRFVVQNKALREKTFGTCSSATAPTAACIDGFLNGSAERILRRPLKDTEKAFARKIANGGGTYLVNLASTLSYFLQSPHFLWRIEGTPPSSAPADRLPLTQYQIATRLAFAATDSIPDATLLAAAKAGRLKTTDEIRSQTHRLLTSPRGKLKLVRALAWWAMADRTADISGLPAQLLSGITVTGLQTAMTKEAEKFITSIVFDEKGSFRDLLTSKKSFAGHAGLAAIYGHAPVTSAAAPAVFPDRRQGLLMRAPFLTWDTSRSSIIHRGVDFQKRFLCNKIPAPTVDIADEREVDVLPHDIFLRTSNRDAISHQTKSPVCMSCHATINPTGFAFEGFDPLGRIRARESTFDMSGNFVTDLPIDSSARVPLPGGRFVDVNDAYDLVGFVASSPEGSACATKSLYRYLNEKIETDADACELDRAHRLMNDPNKSVLDGVVELIANEHVTEKVL